MNEYVVPLVSEQEIKEIIDGLGKEISKDYKGKPIHMICLLKGAVTFMVDLARRIDTTVTFDFMDVSSYGSGTESSGIIRIMKDLDDSIEGKHILLVDDIIDSGRTLSHIIQHLKLQNPASIKICALLNKPGRRKILDVGVDYVGMTIPNEFVVGYGLDYDQRYRNLPYIGILHFGG